MAVVIVAVVVIIIIAVVVATSRSSSSSSSSSSRSTRSRSSSNSGGGCGGRRYKLLMWWFLVAQFIICMVRTVPLETEEANGKPQGTNSGEASSMLFKQSSVFTTLVREESFGMAWVSGAFTGFLVSRGSSQ
ncbi:hypothetical protein ElyMa_006969900 [Elysia marginata]|uniref:Uncharacterized protein n=1 Tax=Elysia marginata TaxID=1093978 RepID=A0AAV4JP37_9GAST|nr:hypothetical protein ElyMa_006969900 [Elysia marginata]